jgi:hypothetical protein
MKAISPSLLTTVRQQVFTAAGLAVEMAVTYGAMPIFIKALPTDVYTTIIFVIGGGAGFIATHITRTMFRSSQNVCFLNSIKEEKVRGAIYLTILSVIATIAMVLHL